MVTPGDLEGEYYYTGDDINIRWDKTTGGNVLIELYKADALVDTIANEIANSSGYYPWFDCTTFGMDSGEDYSIKVTHLSESGCGDQTNLFELIDISECFIQFPWTSKDTIPDQTAGCTCEYPIQTSLALTPVTGDHPKPEGIVLPAP